MENERASRRRPQWAGTAGLGIIAAAEILLFWGVPWVKTYFTPLVWTGYILFIDSLAARTAGSSLIFGRTREFLLLLPLSVVLWLIFEFYNVYLDNWHYVGLPEELFPWRLLGYYWAFATIWPAILLTAEALRHWGPISRSRIPPIRVT
ncbi:MAG TPA: hypothetical protein VLS90_11085, partial [Thermodesulfobacteriota bacterium]|nr:hypothetical protein [Thermodesulfobacteriota bacterium]